MQLTFKHRAPKRPTFLTVGTWDPITVDHIAMLRDLKERACEQSALPAVIIMEPSPSAFIQGIDRWISFEPLESRIERFRAQDIDAIGVIAFEERDLSAGAPEFFDLISSKMTVSQLWLGFRQSLGSGPAGSLDRIAAEAKARKISVRRLPPSNGFLVASTARRYIGMGQVAVAASTVGISPIWRSDPCSPTLTAWPVGDYWAMALNGPDEGKIHRLPFKSGGIGRWNQICWPCDACSRYAMLAGPSDAPDKIILAIETARNERRGQDSSPLGTTSA